MGSVRELVFFSSLLCLLEELPLVILPGAQKEAVVCRVELGNAPLSIGIRRVRLKVREARLPVPVARLPHDPERLELEHKIGRVIQYVGKMGERDMWGKNGSRISPWRPSPRRAPRVVARSAGCPATVQVGTPRASRNRSALVDAPVRPATPRPTGRHLRATRPHGGPKRSRRPPIVGSARWRGVPACAVRAGSPATAPAGSPPPSQSSPARYAARGCRQGMRGSVDTRGPS